jgi:hypothetical protein
MAILLTILGAGLFVIGVLASAVTLTNSVALAISLLITLVGAVLLAGGAIVHAGDRLRPKPQKADPPEFHG